MTLPVTAKHKLSLLLGAFLKTFLHNTLTAKHVDMSPNPQLLPPWLTRQLLVFTVPVEFGRRFAATAAAGQGD